jgi:6-phosphogluconolactonase
MAVRWLACEDREQAAQTVAELISSALAKALAVQSSASLVVSGGSTPARTFELLSDARLAWPQVSVLPSDERCVPAEHPDSNAGMIRARLLRGPAADARLLPLYSAGEPAPDLGVLLPFSCVLLGMGADGHFASLFPDFDELHEALDIAAPPRIVEVRTAASPHPRVSLSLSALVRTPCLLLLMFGEDKRSVYEAALAGETEFPVAALLGQADLPLTTVWAP